MFLIKLIISAWHYLTGQAEIESSSQKTSEDLISSCLIQLSDRGSNASIGDVQDSSPNGVKDVFIKQREHWMFITYW